MPPSGLLKSARFALSCLVRRWRGNPRAPASRSRSIGACYPPRVELEVVLACESSVFVFAPGQADAALLAKMNAITAAILK